MAGEMSGDGLCRRCGRCCYHKLIVGDDVYYTPLPCRHLDARTNLCAIYAERHAVEPMCLTVEEGIRRRVFPADCPYVEGMAEYRPPIERWEGGDYDEMMMGAAGTFGVSRRDARRYIEEGR